MFADGTAAQPSITFINDTDTGLYRVSSGNIGFVADGTPVVEIGAASGMLINSAGTLGFLSGSLGTGADVTMTRAWAGGMSFDSDLRFTTANKGLQFKQAGADTKNRTFGVVTLSAGGSATIYSTAITTTGAIFLSSMGASGFAYISTSTQNVSAVVTSSNTSGTPSIAWLIVTGIS